jgi:hypothetical protein
MCYRYVTCVFRVHAEIMAIYFFKVRMIGPQCIFCVKRGKGFKMQLINVIFDNVRFRLEDSIQSSQSRTESADRQKQSEGNVIVKRNIHFVICFYTNCLLY